MLLILNQSEELMDEDLRLLEQTKDFKRIILLNKTDLPTKIDMDKVKEFATRQRDCHNVNAEKRGHRPIGRKDCRLLLPRANE